MHRSACTEKGLAGMFIIQEAADRPRITSMCWHPVKLMHTISEPLPSYPPIRAVVQTGVQLPYQFPMSTHCVYQLVS